MRILFNNIFENATFTATNESSNYPIENIVDQYLNLRFQSLGANSLVTLNYTSDQSFSCFWYGYHSLDSLVVTYKDSLGATIHTINITSPEDIGVEYFTAITTIRSVEINMQGPPSFYVGGIGGGICYQTPDILMGYSRPKKDNSIRTGSTYGQKQQSYIKPLRFYSFGFKVPGEGSIDELQEKYSSVGVGKPIFIDIFEENHQKEPPIYATIQTPIDANINYRINDTNLNIEEAR